MLLRLLSSSLGRSQASRELRWMQQACDSGASTVPLELMVRRRLTGEPLQYILGTQPFGPLNLLTRPPVLIPRPETEHWVTMLTQSLSPTPRNPVSLLDLGTGSGCIPLLLCHLWPPGSVYAHAVDISTHALRLAEDNAKICAIQSQKNEKKAQNTFSVHQANFLAQDFSKFASRINSSFDIITSNPPYIPFDEFLKLSPSVLDFEDPKALFGGPSGLEFYHAIAQLVSNEGILTPNATVALEVGHDQASSVENIMRATGRFRLTEIWLDPWGKQRTVIARA